jgi:putative pyruvate formate lyase activating enzyme
MLVRPSYKIKISSSIQSFQKSAILKNLSSAKNKFYFSSSISRAFVKSKIFFILAGMPHVENLYRQCRLCPRRCGASRPILPPPGEKSAVSAGSGYCGESAALRLACASIHRGEEPPLTGGARGGGSGTIFVSGCNLGCVFCQNRQISTGSSSLNRQKRAWHGSIGRPVSTEEFVRICLALQSRGAENINIVTGSHAVPALAGGIAAARAGISGPAPEGPDRLRIPVLWNSSAYELPETLDLLADTVDVFLPDMKTLDEDIADRYCSAPDYPAAAKEAVLKMMALRSLGFEKAPEGPARMVSGVMIRHLVLPGHTEATRTVLRWFADHCAGRALLSLMFQYTPLGAGPQGFVTEAEAGRVLGWLEEFGIDEGYCQEPVPGNTGWLPDFEKTNPFPSELSVPVWHWREGFVLQNSKHEGG